MKSVEVSNLLANIMNVDWAQIISSFASVATAIIAIFALRNWQHQAKAKRQADFLDELLDAMYSYIAEMSGLIILLSIAKSGINAIQSSSMASENEDTRFESLATYMSEIGETHKKVMYDEINNIRPYSVRLNFLAAKGVVFKFENYDKCKSAIDEMSRQFSAIEGFATIIGMKYLNMENSKVRSAILAVAEIDSEQVRENINKSSEIIIEYITTTNENIYK